MRSSRFRDELLMESKPAAEPPGLIIASLTADEDTRRRSGGQGMDTRRHSRVERTVWVARALVPLWMDLWRLSLRLALASLRPVRATSA
jgi:hypothetical protein